MAKQIIITTTNDVPGRKITKILGIAKGNTVRARNLGREIAAGLKHLIGGEIQTYTDMASHARDEAFNRMVNEAIEMNADAIVGMRFTTSTIMTGSSEMLAFGTAVKLK